jgi:glycine/D-amino acid oxidase-like deaminating enzyme
MYDYPKLEQSLKTDVVVLGGGISGALAAYYLSKAGINCTVLDARNIGLGSSCASTSLLQYEIDVPLSELQNKIGYKNAVKAYQLCAQSILKLQDIAGDIGFTNFQLKKSLYYAADKKHVSFLKKEFDIRKENNFEVEWLTGKDVKYGYGFSAPAAILSELGGQTDAYAFAHHLHQFNLRNGCKVFDRTKAINISHNKNSVVIKTENNQTITCNKLLYATGYEAVNFVNKKIVNLNSTYVTISEHTNVHKNFWNDDALIWNTDNPYLYMRTTTNGRIIVGGRDEKFYDPLKRDALIEKKAKLLQKDFHKLFPKIPFNPVFAWTGTFGTTTDGLPFIGPYRPLPNSFFALGFGGNGITFSLIAAEIITGMLLGKNEPDLKIFSFERI